MTNPIIKYFDIHFIFEDAKFQMKQDLESYDSETLFLESISSDIFDVEKNREMMKTVLNPPLDWEINYELSHFNTDAEIVTIAFTVWDENPFEQPIARKDKLGVEVQQIYKGLTYLFDIAPYVFDDTIKIISMEKRVSIKRK